MLADVDVDGRRLLGRRPDRRRDRRGSTLPVDAQVDFTARNVFDYTYDGAGNWPFNTAYAATRADLRGFVTRLRSLTEAEAFIAAGIPLVVSVSSRRAS